MSSSLGELADHQNSKTSSSSSSSTSTTSSISYSTPPALIAFTLTVVVVCFICFSAVYFCRCYLVSVIQTWALHHPASATLMRLSPAPNTNSRSPFTGLHPSLLHSFPTFPFSSLPKDDTIREMKYKLECAICLVEFEEDSTLRQLPVCWHMFHQDCVDLWLRSNKTCPVCRTDLETRKCLDDEHTVEEQGGGSSDEVRIDVNEEEEEGGEAGEQRFSRSHSTGHSIVMVRGGGDRLGRNDDDGYRLRLQKHATLGSVGRGKHSCSRSCATYREMMMMVVVARPSTTDYLQIMPASSSPIALQNV